MSQCVYLFSEADGNDKNKFGGKGANLAAMTALGLPIPRGFTVTTDACTLYYEKKGELSKDIENEIMDKLSELERITGKSFGDPENALLVSVRSGARASMPGMMDTILNLGLNEAVVAGMARVTGNPRFAYDSYRRFIQMFSDVVMEVPKIKFEDVLDDVKGERGVKLDTDLTADDLMQIVSRYKEIYSRELGSAFPEDPKEQLLAAVKAVFRSWDNPRANVYRRMNDIPASWGTAVNVQEMVYGNMGNDSGTGVAFTRNPATGERKLYGEFLINAQGEDVVAGIRTPQTIDKLRDIMPEVFDEFTKYCTVLENNFRDMQDMEFTIERGHLFMLQTRNGKRTAAAAIKIAVDLVAEGMISKEEAIFRVEPKQLESLLHPNFDPLAIAKAKPIVKGLPASPGAATGKVFFTSESAIAAHNAGEKNVILVRLETSPEDIEGMDTAQGVLTGRGGMTSHAAVVARGMGKCCVSGCGDIKISDKKRCFITADGRKFSEGDYISLDGTTGCVYGEKIATVDAALTGDFATLMGWADSVRRLRVRTNADTPRDAAQARTFGAEGIGLCRTEHMFFESDRIMAMREMIVADSETQRRIALAKLLPMQRSDFEALFRTMSPFPVTIRFLDPPLHEFLPSEEGELQTLAKQMNLSIDILRAKVESLKEFNPMMGHRGCRLAVSYSEIAEMQTTAVIEAAINTIREGYNVEPEIMIPLIGDPKELQYVKNIVTTTAQATLARNDFTMSYKVGTMIEIPRAALLADEIAVDAEFFSFGTNDLTQLTYGFSRDDAGTFLEHYYTKKIFEQDPFARLDRAGVGKLVKMAAKLGRETRPDIKLGICGEHGGDPSSVEFCHQIGLDYVSCSPFRVPIARLAAAQAALQEKK